MIYGYARVSSKTQNIDRQIKALKDYSNELTDDNIFIDKESGKDFNREKYQELKDIITTGDTLIIKELDRLGRNKEQVKEELKYYKDNEIKVKILNIPTTLINLPKENSWISDMINNILIEVLSAVAEEERNKIKERQREGIELAKKRGVYKGRPHTYTKNHKGLQHAIELYNDRDNNKMTVNDISEITGVSRATLYRNIRKK